MVFSSPRDSWCLGHVSTGFSRPGKSCRTRPAWTNNHEGHKEPCLCCCLGSWPLDISQQRGLPAGCRLFLCAPECGHGEIDRKTLVHPHHTIQDLQVNVCLFKYVLVWTPVYFLIPAIFFPPAAYLWIRQRICPTGWTICLQLFAALCPAARWRYDCGRTPTIKCVATAA